MACPKTFEQNITTYHLCRMNMLEHFFCFCLRFAFDTTKKWNLKHHLDDKLKAF